MTKQWLGPVTLISSLAAWGGAYGQDQAAPQVPIVGYIADSSAFALTSKRGGSCLLQRGRLEAGKKDAAVQTAYEFAGTVDPGLLICWRIKYSCCWQTTSPVSRLYYPPAERVPLKEIELFKLGNKDTRAVFDREFGNRIYTRFSWPLEPAMTTASELLVAGGRVGWADVTKDEVTADFVPTSGDAGWLFVLAKSRMVGWEGVGNWHKTEKRWAVHWMRKEEFDAGFQEPFVAYLAKDAYLFVTQSGRVYLAPKREKGPRQARPVWQDPAWPVLAVITDADTQRSFAFAGTRGAVKGTVCCFELNGIPKGTYYNVNRIKPVKIEEPLKTVTEYAQLLIEEKIINLTPSQRAKPGKP